MPTDEEIGKENVMVYIPAPSCPNGKHVLIDAEPPFYAICEKCNTRFYLIAESVIEKLDVKVIQRPVIKQ